MYCTECGTQLPDTARFCSNCGMATSRPEPINTPINPQVINTPVNPQVVNISQSQPSSQETEYKVNEIEEDEDEYEMDDYEDEEEEEEDNLQQSFGKFIPTTFAASLQDLPELEIDVLVPELKLYDEPSTDGNLIGVFQLKSVIGLERDAHGEWVYVQSVDNEEIEGWAILDDLDIDSPDIKDLPVI